VHVQERVKQEKRTRPPRMRSILREKWIRMDKSLNLVETISLDDLSGAQVSVVHQWMSTRPLFCLNLFF
jgi:hypothetical protein